MLLGEYEHTLDAKGRLAMPAKLRESLGSKFIITKGLDGCLLFTIWSNGISWNRSWQPCR